MALRGRLTVFATRRDTMTLTGLPLRVVAMAIALGLP